MPVNSSSVPTTTSTGPRTPDATASSSPDRPPAPVALLGDPTTHTHAAISQLLARHGIALVTVAEAAPIPGSHWGEPEAGVRGTRVYARADTPVHSVLHESCHVICMDPLRRGRLDTDAGGSALEECAVCYLSIILAAQIPDFGSQRMLDDMDSWGYSFRLGSAARWFHEDADDARDWLQGHRLLDHRGHATGRMRAATAPGSR